MQDQNGTIQQDVQNNGDAQMDDDQNRPLTPREEALARIEAANQAEVDRQNQEFRQAHGIPEEPTPNEGRNDGGNQDQPAEQQAAAVTMVKVKVDGEEMELPISEVVKGYQKDATADKRLREAAERLKEIEAREQALSAGQQQSLSGEPDEEARERAARIATALIEGDVDAAIEDLAGVLAGRGGNKAQQPGVDQDQVRQLVQQTLTEQEVEREYEQAKNWFTENHADLNSNPRTAALVNDEYFKAIEQGLSPLKATEQAVKEVRDFINSFAPQQQQQQNTQQTRQSRKQNYDSITPAGGRVDMNTQQQQDDNSPAAVVAQMKRARGQG